MKDQIIFKGRAAQEAFEALTGGKPPLSQAPGSVSLELWEQIRWKLMDEHEKEACKLLNANDAYGYNFHKGIVAGCNKLDIAIRSALQAPPND